MTLLYRLLRWWSAYEVAQVDYRLRKLTESLSTNAIDLDAYIERKSSMQVERMKSSADLRRWDAVLDSLAIGRMT